MNVRFHFEATDAQGGHHEGEVEAPTRAAAHEELLGRRWTILTLDPIIVPKPGDAGSISAAEFAVLLDQLQTISEAGMPLPAGLRAAELELESRRLRQFLGHLADHLDRGQGLDSALLAEANRFPAHLQGLVRAGQRAGRLGDVLAEFVQGNNLGTELRRQIGGALAYPAMILLIVLGLTGFVCRISSQMIESLTIPFDDMARTTPSVARSVFAMSQFIAANDLKIVLGAVVFGAVCWAAWGLLMAPLQRRRLVNSLPLIGPLARSIALAEYCHLLALLVEAATPLPEAIHLAGSSVDDASLAHESTLVAAAVARGEPFIHALQRWTGLPAGLGQLLAWGEGQQNLAGALRFAGDMFESRAGGQARFARQVFSSSLLLLIIWWLGFAAASIYLPIAQSIQMISKLTGLFLSTRWLG